jgi:hypothetical protein
MLFDEQIMTFTEAAKALPSVNGRRIHVSTLWRWSQRGVGGIRLETRRLGGRVVTSKEALERFTSELATQSGPEAVEPVDKRPRLKTAVRQEAVADCKKYLKEEGL